MKAGKKSKDLGTKRGQMKVRKPMKASRFPLPQMAGGGLKGTKPKSVKP